MSRQEEWRDRLGVGTGGIDQVVTGSAHSFFFRRHPEKRKAGCICG